MKWILPFFLAFLAALQAKPIIDLRDANMSNQHRASYDRPNFTFMTQGKNSHVVVLSDSYLELVDSIRAQGYEKVIAYLMEPRAIYPGTYRYVDANADKYDLILTFDKELLERHPHKAKFVHAVGWGTLHDHAIHPKSKMCSIMTGKNWTEGHILRLAAYERYKPYFDGYKGYDTPWERWKDSWLNDFHFAVIVENSSMPHYFTEKIVECLRAGTVPIYWGCPTIGEFFDLEGFIIFQNLDELGPILKSLSVEEYNRRLPAIRRNFELAAKYPQCNLVTRPDFPDSMDVLWPYVQGFFPQQ